MTFPQQNSRFPWDRQFPPKSLACFHSNYCGHIASFPGFQHNRFRYCSLEVQQILSSWTGCILHRNILYKLHFIMCYWHSTIKFASQEVLLKQYKPINSPGNLYPSLQNTVCFVAQKFMATNPIGEHGPEHTKTCFCEVFCPFALWLLCCWININI